MPGQLSSEPVVGIVDAALLPASLAARVSRETRSCSTRTGRVRRQNIRSASRSPIFSRLWTASGRSWIERRSVIVRVVSRRLRRPQRALPRGSSCHGFSAFCRGRSMKRSSVGPLVEALGRARAARARCRLSAIARQQAGRSICAAAMVRRPWRAGDLLGWPPLVEAVGHEAPRPLVPLQRRQPPTPGDSFSSAL